MSLIQTKWKEEWFKEGEFSKGWDYWVRSIYVNSTEIMKDYKHIIVPKSTVSNKFILS
jgi:hypothetical protein